jgi:3-methyladenine DNA glycosylase AlkD
LTSDVSRRAAEFVEARRDHARSLGARLADLTEDPDSFTRLLTEGLEGLADHGYGAEQERVAPGSGPTIGVRVPLMRSVISTLRQPFAEASSSSVLWLAQRLAASPYREVRLFALPALERALPDDPERAWQLLRRMAHAANDWISVDSLAGVYAVGILQEPFRWAEIEQLIYSRQRMERRLVGSTLATLPHRLPRGVARRTAADLNAPRALALLRQLMGDSDDQVQKALSWAVREWSRVAQVATEQLIRDEAQIAVETVDGNRAWVLRDSLAHVDARLATYVRAGLAGLRRRPHAESTSPASRAAADFLGTALPGRDVADLVTAAQGQRFGGWLG